MTLHALQKRAQNATLLLGRGTPWEGYYRVLDVCHAEGHKDRVRTVVDFRNVETSFFLHVETFCERLHENKNAD